MANNSINLSVVKVGQLDLYSNIDVDDYFLTIESSSYQNEVNLYSRKSNFQDLINFLSKEESRKYTGSFTGSLNGISIGNFSGSFDGNVSSKNLIGSGNLSGSLYGNLISKNVKATGSFYGNNMYGSLIGNNLSSTGYFSGSFYGKLVGTVYAKGKFSGSLKGSLVSKNLKATGSFTGTTYGRFYSKNVQANGDWSGSFIGGSAFSNAIISGSNCKFVSTNLTDINNLIVSDGLIISTGSITNGINYTTLNNIPVSYMGTSSYSVSSSYSVIAKNISGYSGKYIEVYKTKWSFTKFSSEELSVEKPNNAVWTDFEIYINGWFGQGTSSGRVSCTIFWGSSMGFSYSGKNINEQYDEGIASGTINYYPRVSGGDDDDSQSIQWNHCSNVPSDLVNNKYLQFICNTNGPSPGMNSVSIIARYYIKE